MGAKTISLEEARSRWLENPEARRIYEESELAYQVARLRIMRGLTQQELAELVGTKQPSIARLESGRTNPSLRSLTRVLDALGGSLSLEAEPAVTFAPETNTVNVLTRVPVQPVPKVKSKADPTESINVTSALVVAV